MNHDLETKLREAIRHFWTTRERQHAHQGEETGKRDQGSRRAVTAGRQLDGFVSLLRSLLLDAGLPDHTIPVRTKGGVVLPGFFRPTKQWDLLVIADGNLLATIELKSHVGPSFGSNYNNRTEEAIGSATDFWTAYREGAFKESSRPWLGYLMVLEEAEASTSPTNVEEPHFPVFPEFVGASYARRYELLCKRLVRERLYDAACLLLSDRQRGPDGHFNEPCEEVCFLNFATSLTARVLAYTKHRMNNK